MSEKDQISSGFQDRNAVNWTHNKTAPGRCANTVHPGASPTGLESTDV